MLKSRWPYIGQFLVPFLFIFCLFGCASRQPPGGGPRDREPPKLLKATPPNMTRNFKGKQLQLQFDEYFKLNNQYTEITMTPVPEKTPEYKIRKKTLVINLQDSLEKNTTYVINFGKAIQDVNEGNTLTNFTYVFSTGPHIDSLSISGNVYNTETGKPEKDATVMLFTLKQDTALFGKKKPTIYTNTDSTGNFSLNNLHAQDYKIYALKEKSPNKIYDNDQELIAFSPKIIHLTKDTSNVQLKLFKQVPKKLRVEGGFMPNGSLQFQFNKSIDTPSVSIAYPKDFDQYKIAQFSKTNDTATIYMKNMDFDSLAMIFYSGKKPLDTISRQKGRRETFKRILSFRSNINSDGKLKPTEPLLLSGNIPVDSFDPTMISLKEDSNDVSNFNIVKDTSVVNGYKVNYRWKAKASYTLTLGPGAFTDIYGDKNERQPIRFQLDNPDNYSMLTLTTTVPDTTKQYIVELLNSKEQILRRDVIRKNTSLVYKNYITGKYTVKVIYDDNKNGKYDTGNIKLNKQPEKIWFDTDVISLRPNWDQQTPISIPKESSIP